MTKRVTKAATNPRTNGRTLRLRSVQAPLLPFVACDPRRLDDVFLAPAPVWELGAMFSAPHPDAAVVMAPGKLEVLPAPLPRPQPPAKPKRDEEEGPIHEAAFEA
jgi:hypothetical protein